jgi:glutamate transport system substrate-binding protein
MLTSRSSRRRLVTIGAITAVSALALSACSADSPTPSATSATSVEQMLAGAPVADDALFTAGSTMEKIRDRGTLIVAQALDAPLLSQQDPTNPDDVSGFDAYLAQLLSVYIFGQPSVEIVPPASETREALLQNGTVDVVFNTYTITEQRAEQISFAGPYFSSGLAVAVRAENDDIMGIDDLGGKTVIVGANTPAVIAVPEKQPTANLVDFATDPQAVQALLQGRGDAYVQDYTLLASNAAANPKLKVVGQPFTAEPYGIGLGFGDAEFKNFINNWLLKIQEGGQWGQAWTYSLGTVVESEIPTPPSIGSVPGS